MCVYKNLRIVIPAVQVLAVVCVQGWERATNAERILLLYVLPSRHIVMNLNFPLAMIWWPITRTSELSSNYLPLVSFPRGIGLVQTAFAVLFAVAVFVSIFLFWYFIVAVVQMRKCGKSLTRFSNRTSELIKVVVLFFSGIATCFYAYREAILPFQHGWSHGGLWPIETILAVLFLVAWEQLSSESQF